MALTRSETDLGEVDCGSRGELLICNSDRNPLCLHPELVRSHLTFFGRGSELNGYRYAKSIRFSPFIRFAAYARARLIDLHEGMPRRCIYKSALSISFRIPIRRSKVHPILDQTHYSLVLRSDRITITHGQDPDNSRPFRAPN